jgi:hypothetical protein
MHESVVNVWLSFAGNVVCRKCRIQTQKNINRHLNVGLSLSQN